MAEMTPAEKAREQMRSMGLSAPYIGSRETRTEEEIARDRKTLAENVPVLGEAILAKEIAGDVKDKDYIGAGLNTLALAAGVVPGPGKALSKGIRKFNKTRKAYKLFVKGEDEKLYPLFVDANKPVKQGEFLEANFPDATFKGKRKEGSKESFYVPTKGAKRSKGEKAKGTGDSIIIPDEATRQKLIDEGFITEKTRRTKEAPFGKVTAVAARPGWHASQAPVATHLGPQDLKVSKKEAEKLVESGVTPEAIKRRGNQFYVKRRAEDQVFAEVDMADDVDYQSMLAKEGRSDINDRVPKGGSYKYSDGQADSDQWVVGGDMKVNRVLSREETRAIQKEMGVVDLPYRDEVESILGRKFSKKIKLEKFEPAKVAKINKTWWLDKDTVTLYHGTNKRNLKNVSGEGLKPDAEGFVYLTPDPNTAAGYASMSGTGGEAAFRKSGRAVHTPEEDRVILKYEIPKKEFLKKVDQNKQRKGPLNPNYDVDKDKLFNKDVFDKHIKRKAKDDYYATTEIRFPENNPFDKYLTSFSNRKNALKLDELELAEGGVVMDDYQLAKITDEPQNYATGGIAKQMEMFQDGGLMDEGGTVDPVSGNDVPPGSTQEEVRDDIPAQLSEGEFVFPADVVRFIGLEKLMKIRQQAKAGLKRMEEMGQMGNADEATMPDDVPFTIDDLDMEDEEPLEFQLGGTVPKAGTGIVGYTTPNIPTTGVSPNLGNNPTGMQPPPFSLQPIAFTGTAQQPMQAASQQQMMPSVQPGILYPPGFSYLPPGFQPPPMNLPPTDPATGQLKLPTFYDVVGQPGAAGQATTTPDPTAGTTPDPVATTTAQPDDGGGDNMQDDPIQGELDFSNLGNLGAEAKRAFTNLTDPIRELFGMESKLGDRKDAEAMAGLGSLPGSYLIGDIFESANRKTDAFGGSEKFGLTNPELRSATLKQAGAQLATIGITNPLTAIMKDLGILDFKVDDIGRAGFSGMNAALGSLGFTNRGQLFNNAQATLVGSAMAAAHAASLKGLSPTEVQAEYNKVLNTPAAKQIQRNSYNTIKSSIAENMGRTSISDRELVEEMARVERTAVEAERVGFNRQTPANSRPGQAADADFRSNVITDSKGNAVVQERSKTKANPKGNPVLSEKGRRTKSRLNNTINQARTVKNLADRVAGVTGTTGYPAGVTQRDFGQETVVESAAREAANRAQAERQQAARDARAARDAARSIDPASVPGDFGDTSGDVGASDGGGYGSDAGTGGGGDMGVICLTEDMKVRRNGVIDFVTNVQVGDIVDYTKVTEVLHKHMREGYYVVNGELKITNDHPVLANGSWKRTEDLMLGDYINDVKVASIEYIEKVTPTVYIGTEADRYTVYTEGATYTVHGQYKNALKKAA